LDKGRSGRVDFWSGVVLLVLGAYIVLQARRWEYMTAEGPGAGFFPYWYGIAMFALGTLLAAQSMLRPALIRPDFSWAGARRALAIWVLLAGAVWSFSLLGFFGGFALLSFFIVAILYRRPAGIAAFVAAGETAAFYLVFELALGVPLPAGALSF
jgi:putative tricarboxylic transport membrane protein